jgi:hypothetical protein
MNHVVVSNVINLDDYRQAKAGQPTAADPGAVGQFAQARKLVEPAPDLAEEEPGPALPWRESRRGNLYTTTTRFHCVVYPVGRAWGYRITERTTEQGAYSHGRFYSQNAAVAAAEEALGDFERDPRAWG